MYFEKNAVVGIYQLFHILKNKLSHIMNITVLNHMYIPLFYELNLLSINFYCE